MDYGDHNDELQFKLLLRQRLTRFGLDSIMAVVNEELLALATFLESDKDYTNAENYRYAARILQEATETVADSIE